MLNKAAIFRSTEQNVGYNDTRKTAFGQQVKKVQGNELLASEGDSDVPLDVSAPDSGSRRVWDNVLKVFRQATPTD